MPLRTLLTPSKMIASVPAAAMPAPTIEKTRAWLELDGMPYHQVIRFQVIAAMSDAPTNSIVASSGGMMPLPMVVATAVPVRAPRTFMTAAISTARPGLSTRVATEVAIALAVSWKPLMKSKPRPSATMMIRTIRSELGIFDQDAFERMPDVLALVGGAFEQRVNLAPAERLDDLRDLGYAVVQRGEGLVEGIVGLVFEPVELERASLNLADLFLGLREKDLAEEAGRFGRHSHLVEPNPAAGLLETIDEVVQHAGQIADVIPVERGDEGAVEGLVDAMRDVVAGVLEVAQAADLAFGIWAKFDDFSEELGGFEGICGGFGEVVEKLLIPWQESRQYHRCCSSGVDQGQTCCH